MPEFSTPKKRKTSASYNQAPPRSKPAQKTAAKPKKANNTQKSSYSQKSSSSARNKQRRKQNMSIYYMMFLLVSAVVFSVLSATVLFNLEEVTAVGESIYTHEEIIAAADIKPGVNLIRFNSGECEARIAESLVYIDSVHIKKNLPGKLVINVVGAEEMANIEHEGNYYIISKNGRILGLADKNSENTVIYGYEADEPVIGARIKSISDRKTDLVYKLMNTAENVGLTGIVDIDISDYLNISMNYMNRIELHIGASTELEQKFRASAELLEKEIDKNEYGTLRLIDPLKVVFKPETLERPEIAAVAEQLSFVPGQEQNPETPSE
ncbi:MAG: FtsQ-type POTRA domain-containing protein [Oscillospiraceae bacterium]|nr:FtsQ-type POTRA domain-containing protein [Oscillospiraceae bacterium]